MSNSAIGILGCGWLGEKLAESLLQEGIEVKGSTTTEAKQKKLQQKNITAYQLVLGAHTISGDIDSFLNGIKTIIINVPPKLRRPNTESYFKKMELLLDHIRESTLKNILFVSSTSVYGDVEGRITEATKPRPTSASGKQLLQVEQLFQNEKGVNCTVIRFGGLIGEDRHPVYHLSGKTMGNGHDLVNLIHRKDCIHMIKTILRNNYWSELFNGVYPYHPTKMEYYTSEAEKRQIPPPIYGDVTHKIYQKRIVFRNFYVKKHHLSTTISS